MKEARILALIRQARLGGCWCWLGVWFAAGDFYSGLTLNQYGVASPCRTICTVCGFVA
ncbi:MAG: hypothetical protein HXM85_09535, partial [Neisseria sp.]|nr:hypothetical protein [Neisseria sp.]